MTPLVPYDHIAVHESGTNTRISTPVTSKHILYDHEFFSLYDFAVLHDLFVPDSWTASRDNPCDKHSLVNGLLAFEGPYMSLDANKALARRFFEELANEGKLELAPEILTPEAIEPVRQLTMMLHVAFPDFHVTILDQIAEDDKVVTRFIAKGTHLGVWRSPLGLIEPTGKQFEHEGIRIHRVADGVLVDTWGGADTLQQLQQLGIIPLSL